MNERFILEAIERCYAGVDCDRRFEEFFRWLAHEVGCDAGDIALEYPETGRMVTLASFGFDPTFLREYDEAYLGRNPWYRELEGRCPTRFHEDGTFSAEFRGSSYQNEWVRPQGLGPSMGAVIGSGAGEIGWIGFAREAGGCGFGEAAERLRALLPHLRRVVALRSRLAEANGDAALLDRLACPAVLLDRRNVVVAANPMGAVFLEEDRPLTVTRTGRLVARRAADDARLQAILSGAWRDGSESARNGQHALAMGIVPGGDPMVVTAVLVGAAGLSGARLLVTASGRHICRDGVKTVAELLDLSPAERSLAAWLATGGTLTDYARDRGISPGTARWHLKNVQRKTGTSRLEQLVSLLHHLAPFIS